MSLTTITQLPDPSGFSADPFTDIIRDGARKLIEQAIQAELAALMAAFADEKLENGTSRLVRHGHLPEREVMTGIGAVPVKVPRVRDRKPGEDKITFTSSILPRYLRKAKSVEELLPRLYLTREQGCWVHKTMNVLNALPKSLQEKPLHRRRDLFGLLFAMRVCIAKIRNQRFDGAHIDRVAGHLETGSVIYPLSRSWADGLRKSSPVGF